MFSVFDAGVVVYDSAGLALWSQTFAADSGEDVILSDSTSD